MLKFPSTDTLSWLVMALAAAFSACSSPSANDRDTGGSSASGGSQGGAASGTSQAGSSGGASTSGAAGGSGGSGGGAASTRSGSASSAGSGGNATSSASTNTGGGPGGASSTGGAVLQGGSSGGTGGSGASTSRGGSNSGGGTTSTGGTQGPGGTTAAGGSNTSSLAKFSFFVTSIEAMRKLSKNQNGFGGDLRYGQADGLAGADKICTEIAESSLAGSGAKGWRAFLSTTAPVNAADRIGNGPWYDRLGRLVADSKANLLLPRPKADKAIANDLPNETGTPNHQSVDNHDTLTGSTSTGLLGNNTKTSTCNDWTSVSTSGFKPIVGHAWPRSPTAPLNDAATNWMNAHTAPGCAPSVNLSSSMGGGSGGVGDGGGYGAIYCFALSP